mgnify:CR=1 FL=1
MVINKHKISYSTPPLEVAPQELYHAKSFWTRYIFFQCITWESWECREDIMK